MKIDFAKLQEQYQLYKIEIDEAIQNILNKSNYIMGEEISQLEESLCQFTGAKHAISCSSGTDALLLAMMALDIKPGDEIITTPFTFIATAETIAFLGAIPVFIDIDEKTYSINENLIEEKISNKTKAIIPVSLFGQPANLEKIQAIANRNNLKVIIDGAQSFGATYKGIKDSNLGDISITSFFPAKPLGCFGDGGAIFTNSETVALKIKQLRVHGQNKRYYHKYIGMGGRLDTIQAAVLNVKLKYYEKDLALRQKRAQLYNSALLEKSDIVLPYLESDRTSTWAQYSIRVNNRSAFQHHMKENGIPTAIHYPMPLHLQECFKYLNYNHGDFPVAERIAKEIISLPMNPYLTKEEIKYISECIRKTKEINNE
jgi:UDP-2-acetamido-2-deoxy-ribo-hexuluronate aminotransferase